MVRIVCLYWYNDVSNVKKEHFAIVTMIPLKGTHRMVCKGKGERSSYIYSNSHISESIRIHSKPHMHRHKNKHTGKETRAHDHICTNRGSYTGSCLFFSSCVCRMYCRNIGTIMNFVVFWREESGLLYNSITKSRTHHTYTLTHMRINAHISKSLNMFYNM